MEAPDLAATIREMGRAARAATGAADIASLRRMKWGTRLAEAIGRVAFLTLPGPVGFVIGVAALSYYFAVEAQLNHTILHGAYVGLPGAGRFTPRRYETLAVPFQCRTWRDGHAIHHAHPSRVGADPDTLHPLFRVHDSTAFRPWHLLNVFVGWLFTFEHWAFDYDSFLKDPARGRSRRAPNDRGELRKLALYVGYQLVLFPALAGARWKEVFFGTLLAIVVRNVIFTGLQTASSVGRGVSTRHARSDGKKRDAERLRFQIETSKDFDVGPVAQLLVGGLDRHIEHHLFPSLPPARLRALAPRVRALCAQHGIEYEAHGSFGDSLSDSVGHLADLSHR